ncbi:MAG: helicase, partial [Chthonomonadales bacterium]
CVVLKTASLIQTVFNFSRPRDVSHYEAFRGYHAAYHMQVENPSVTPFSTGAIARGLSAVVVALSRLQDPNLNAENAAQLAPDYAPTLENVRNSIVKRVASCAEDMAERTQAEQGAQKRVDRWIKRAHVVQGQAAALSYERRVGNHVPLLSRPEDGAWTTFTCLNSLRGVEKASNLVLLDSFEGDLSGSEDSQ